jgi:molybdate/tungstate transport system substrate-binding protein
MNQISISIPSSRRPGFDGPRRQPDSLHLSPLPKNRKCNLVAILLVIAQLFSGSGCNPNRKTPLRVFIAGSLVVPFAELEKSFEALYPEVDVQVEAHGSIQVIRHVTEIGESIDLVVSADYALIPILMYSSTDKDSGQPYASWTIKFAGNHMVLAYQPQSRYADEITASNWYQIIARPEVKYGLSDPRFDAAGYRSLMILQLAESYYTDPTIFERVYLGRFQQPITVQKESGRSIIHVPELLEVSDRSNIVMRGGSVALLALLESGDIDYAFEYQSVARQHGLRYLELPVELNLGDPAYADQYASVQVRLDYQRFSTVKPEFDGEVIGYGLTIPSNAPNPDEAAVFVEFLLGPQGAAIMEANSHPIFPIPEIDHCEALPASLQFLCADHD